MPVYSSVSLTIPDIDAADPVEAAKVFQAAMADYASLPLTYVVEDATVGAGYMIDLQPLQTSADAAYEKAARAQGWRPMTQAEVSAVEWLKDVTINVYEGDIFTKDDEPDYEPHDGFRDWRSLCEWHGIEPADAPAMSEADKLLRDLMNALPPPRSRKVSVPWQRALEYVSRLRTKAEA